MIQSTSDLAQCLNLSRWTISRVLNGHTGVALETTRRVRNAMRELGFSPNSLARGLRKGTTNIIGICIPEIEGLYLGQKMEFLRQALAAEGWHAMVAITNGERQEEGEALSRFRTLHAAGVILFASQLSPHSPPVRQFHETQVPLIFVDPMTRPPKGSLCVDRSTGMREAVLHLFDLGHRHITALGLGYWSLSSAVKRNVKNAVSFIGSFEKAIVRYSESDGVSGVVCGHIHSPVIRKIDGVDYFNCGDWVESCSALVEDFDGKIELLTNMHPILEPRRKADDALPSPSAAALNLNP